MCTDYDVWYACGHKAEPARIDSPEAAKVYVGCTSTTPTARVIRHCAKFQASGEVCPSYERVVITQTFPIACLGGQCKPLAEGFDDDGCVLMWNNLEKSAVDGRDWISRLSEKEKAEMFKASTKICQPPVWGRKGPHVKKQRKVKTKAEKELEKTMLEQTAASRGSVEPAQKPKRGGRRKAGNGASEAGEKPAPAEKPKGRKRKADNTKVAVSKVRPEHEAKVELATKKQKVESLKATPANANVTVDSTAAKKGVVKEPAILQPRGRKRKATEAVEKPALTTKSTGRAQKKVTFVIPDDEEPEQPRVKMPRTKRITSRPKAEQYQVPEQAVNG
ncbi:hypothetical protein DRE_03488 [Drechslerella stenobrocha 248]|uniref:Uncharacterized protein n=1 Tax=Drechslerella stenobrocha 248 TaxID=1043628 RepID=W7HUG2_9PEZI|nr:hypothetical protein DRE_03488 [Drechslerella stenobrocha 248]